MTDGKSLTALDGIAVVLVSFGILGLLAMPIVGASYAAMYADFGSAELPALTRFATSWFGPLLLATLPIGALVTAARLPTLVSRRAAIVLAFVAVCGAIALCWIGFYLPLWQVADAVRAD